MENQNQAKSAKNTERNYWHEPFYQAFRKELEQYKDVLKFLEEPKINTDALFADLIVIKKKPNAKIEKPIANHFKKYNIVEYKSPKDGVTVRAFQKIIAYTALYAFNEKLDFDEMTVTLVGNRHPRELLAWLKKRFAVKREESGIYTANGALFPVQIVETKALDRENYRLLYALGNKLNANELKKTLTKDVLTDEKLMGYIDLIERENPKTYKEITAMMSDAEMLRILRNSPAGRLIMAEGVKTGEKRGIKIGKKQGRLLERQKMQTKRKTKAARVA